MLRDGIVNHQSSVPKVNSIYQNPDDQKLYRALRKEGRTAAEARETLNLMGVKPSTGTDSNSSTVPDWFWGNNRKDKKVDFPFYQHKRKY